MTEDEYDGAETIILLCDECMVPVEMESHVLPLNGRSVLCLRCGEIECEFPAPDAAPIYPRWLTSAMITGVIFGGVVLPCGLIIIGLWGLWMYVSKLVQ